MTALGLASVAALGLAFDGTRASADLLPGSGKPEGNCYAGLDIGDTSEATITEDKTTVYSCVDGSACDLDGACNGSCTFNLGVCINLDGVEGCTAPGMLDGLKVKGNVKGVKGDAGKLKIGVPQLLEGSICGAFVDAVIPLKETKKETKAGKAKVTVNAKAPKGTKPRKSKEKYDLVCEPAPGGCGSSSGAFID